MSLSTQDTNFICQTIRKYFPNSTILAFGSRIQGNNKQFSDLDICIDVGAPIPLVDWALLDEEFSNSNLLYKIDLCDWHRIDSNFQKIILENSENWTIFY